MRPTEPGGGPERKRTPDTLAPSGVAGPEIFEAGEMLIGETPEIELVTPGIKRPEDVLRALGHTPSFTPQEMADSYNELMQRFERLSADDWRRLDELVDSALAGREDLRHGKSVPDIGTKVIEFGLTVEPPGSDRESITGPGFLIDRSQRDGFDRTRPPIIGITEELSILDPAVDINKRFGIMPNRDEQLIFPNDRGTNKSGPTKDGPTKDGPSKDGRGKGGKTKG